jgi:hypothetical protein
MNRKLLVALAVMTLSPLAMAQVGTTIKEGAKATAEKAEELGDDVKAATQSEPKASVTRAKAAVHHAKAHHHAAVAKDAAKEIPK